MLLHLFWFWFYFNCSCWRQNCVSNTWLLKVGMLFVVNICVYQDTKSDPSHILSEEHGKGKRGITKPFPEVVTSQIIFKHLSGVTCKLNNKVLRPWIKHKDSNNKRPVTYKGCWLNTVDLNVFIQQKKRAGVPGQSEKKEKRPQTSHDRRIWGILPTKAA